MEQRKTKLSELDLTLHPRLIVLGGKPAAGKSNKVLEWILELTQDSEKPVAYFSNDLLSRDLCRRIITLGGDTRTLDTPLIYIDDYFMDLEELREHSEDMKSVRGLQLIVVDNIQLLPYHAPSRQESIKDILLNLKFISEQLQVPVLAITDTQRHREPEGDLTLDCFLASRYYKEIADIFIGLDSSGLYQI